MIQCVVCEDWLHGRHLGALVPDSVELQEMICESCMNQNQFLWTYAAHLAVADPEVKPEPDQTKPGPAEPKSESEPCTKRPRHQEEEPKAEKEELKPKRDGSNEEKEGPKEEEESKGACRLKELQLIGLNRNQSGATFWPSGWRSHLCTCSDCQKLLSEAGALFLLDEMDTVLAYETKGRSLERNNQSADPLMSALDRLNRVQQLELIHEYNDLKTELKDFLQRFASEGKVCDSREPTGSPCSTGSPHSSCSTHYSCRPYYTFSPCSPCFPCFLLSFVPLRAACLMLFSCVCSTCFHICRFHVSVLFAAGTPVSHALLSSLFCPWRRSLHLQPRSGQSR